jgi:hypothetical protein
VGSAKSFPGFAAISHGRSVQCTLRPEALAWMMRHFHLPKSKCIGPPLASTSDAANPSCEQTGLLTFCDGSHS